MQILNAINEHKNTFAQDLELVEYFREYDCLDVLLSTPEEEFESNEYEYEF